MDFISEIQVKIVRFNPGFMDKSESFKPGVNFESNLEIMDEIIALRKKVLHPHGPVERVIYKSDALQGSAHFVLFHDGKIIGTGTVQPEDESEKVSTSSWRIRGMAVDPEYQGQGLGQKIVAAIIQYVTAYVTDDNAASDDHPPARLIWCNARVSALNLYQRFGFIAEPGEFIIPNSGPHRRLKLALKPSP